MTAIVVPVSVFLGLGAALLIRSLKAGQSIYKTVYFLPVMASLLAMAIVWEFALHPTLGIVNRTLAMGCGSPLEWWSWFARGCADGFPLWLGIATTRSTRSHSSGSGKASASTWCCIWRG